MSLLLAAAALLSLPPGAPDSLPVALQLEPGIATAFIQLRAPRYLVVLDLTAPRAIEILVPESDPQRLPAGTSEIQLDRPRPRSPDSVALLSPRFKPCYEDQKVSDSDSTKLVSTEACGSAPDTSRARGHPAPATKGEHTILLLAASTPLDASGVRKLLGKARKSPDSAAARSAVLAELAKAGELQSATLVIPPG